VPSIRGPELLPILLTANRCTLISEDRESLSRVPLNISVDCDIEYRRVL
jgi:hypothetical protein